MPKTLANATSQWGASMGRCDHISDPNHPVKFHLVKLRWVDGDYDNGGAYWGGGMGDNIFHAWGDGREDEQEIFVRAPNRFHARMMVRKEFFNARFYR